MPSCAPWWSGRTACTCSTRSAQPPSTVSPGRSASPAAAWRRGRPRSSAPSGRRRRSWPSPGGRSRSWASRTSSAIRPGSSCSRCWAWCPPPALPPWPPPLRRWGPRSPPRCPSSARPRRSSTPMPCCRRCRGTSPMNTWASPPTTGGTGDGWRSPSGTGRATPSGA